MANELIVSEQAQQFLPVMPMAIALQRRSAIVEFAKQIMVKDTDYGIIPGTGTKPSLLKPGAEKLCSFFGLAPVFVPVETIEDWTGIDHDNEAFFLYRYRCELFRNGNMIGSGVGSCNSWESKYRYRSGERVCPHCGKATIIKGKVEFGGGWLCFAKKGGCGAKFDDNDPAIINQSVGKVKNPDPADVVNTIDKMAQKRALVAATLIAVNASEFFTQDVEDMAGGYVDATYTVVATAPQNYVPAPQHEEEQFGRQEPQRQPAQRKATPAPAPKANGNGKPEKESTPHTRFHGQGTATFGPNWDTVRGMIAQYVAHSDTSNDITDANKDALAENFKMNSRDWQKWARGGMDEALMITLMPESVEVQVEGNLFDVPPSGFDEVALQAA